MNSALQCLFNIKELSNFFLYNFDEKYLNKDNILGTGGLLTLGYINLLLIYNNNTNNKYITPETFKIILGLCSKKFEGNEQEDSHEFITYLIDIIISYIQFIINDIFSITMFFIRFPFSHINFIFLKKINTISIKHIIFKFSLISTRI